MKNKSMRQSFMAVFCVTFQEKVEADSLSTVFGATFFFKVVGLLCWLCKPQSCSDPGEATSRHLNYVLLTTAAQHNQSSAHSHQHKPLPKNTNTKVPCECCFQMLRCWQALSLVCMCYSQNHLYYFSPSVSVSPRLSSHSIIHLSTCLSVLKSANPYLF